MKIFLLTCLVMLFPFTAYASGTDIEQEVEVIGGQYAGGSTRAYSVGGGDMDINDCLATHSVLFGLWQGTHINKLCEADRLNRDGQYQAAAEMKCSVRSIRRIYGKNCIERLKLEAYVPVENEPAVIVEPDGDDEDWHREQIMIQEEYDARIAALEQRLEQRATNTRTVVREKEWMTDEKRAKLEAVLAE